MHPARSVLLLAGVVSCVSFGLFAGHAISTHESGAVLLGAGFLGLGIVLLTVFTKTGKQVRH